MSKERGSLATAPDPSPDPATKRHIKMPMEHEGQRPGSGEGNRSWRPKWCHGLACKNKRRISPETICLSSPVSVANGSRRRSGMIYRHSGCIFLPWKWTSLGGRRDLIHCALKMGSKTPHRQSYDKYVLSGWGAGGCRLWLWADRRCGRLVCGAFVLSNRHADFCIEPYRWFYLD